MKQVPKIYTPGERGRLAYEAGCSIKDHPLGLSSVSQAEWRQGWRSAHWMAEMKENQDVLKGKIGEL